MNSPIITKVIEEMNDLPDALQQQVLTYILNLRQEHSNKPDNAWDVLESLTGTIEAPTDWSKEHDHYLYGTPKQSELNP
jgi:N6-adenosine-specific RNA methylase IME4